MNGKKILGALLCKSAFTQRNLTSIGLVGIFFIVYVLAGGKISTDIPSMEEMEQRKAKTDREILEEEQTLEEDSFLDLSEGDSKKVLGITPTKDRQARRISALKEGRLFTEEERASAEQEKVDPSGLVKGEKFISRQERLMLERSEKKPKDSLSAIEERLKIRR